MLGNESQVLVKGKYSFNLGLSRYRIERAEGFFLIRVEHTSFLKDVETTKRDEKRVSLNESFRFPCVCDFAQNRLGSETFVISESEEGLFILKKV